MLSESIISDIASFCAEKGYSQIGGSFYAREQSPEDYDIPVEVEIIVRASGNYMMWMVHPLSAKVIGKWDEGFGTQRILLGESVPEDEKRAVLEGIAARLQ